MPTVLARLAIIVSVLVALGVAPGAAQEASDLDVSAAEGFMGDWNLTLQTDQGDFVMSLELEDASGKVKGTITNDFSGATNVTDISTADDNLVLKYSADMQGQSVPVQVTLKPDGNNLDVAFDFDGQFFIDGTGSRP